MFTTTEHSVKTVEISETDISKHISDIANVDIANISFEHDTWDMNDDFIEDPEYSCGTVKISIDEELSEEAVEKIEQWLDEIRDTDEVQDCELVEDDENYISIWFNYPTTFEEEE